MKFETVSVLGRKCSPLEFWWAMHLKCMLLSPSPYSPGPPLPPHLDNHGDLFLHLTSWKSSRLTTPEMYVASINIKQGINFTSNWNIKHVYPLVVLILISRSCLVYSRNRSDPFFSPFFSLNSLVNQGSRFSFPWGEIDNYKLIVVKGESLRNHHTQFPYSILQAPQDQPSACGVPAESGLLKTPPAPHWGCLPDVLALSTSSWQ